MSAIAIRRAGARDLAALVALLAEDDLGRGREDARDPPAACYRDAFAAIDADPNQFLAVVEAEGGGIVGTLHLTFIPGLSRLGAWRGQIESVRVAAAARGRGIGRRMFDWAIAECARRGCRLVQLTSDKTRKDAQRFYERLGFVASHEGYKLTLEAREP